jgi:hypothetical protein
MSDLTRAEKHILGLLKDGYHVVNAHRSIERMIALAPPDEHNAWSGGAVYVRRSTMDSLKAKGVLP